ncbi:hypothetical protein LPW26_03315 [Rhodopseudomonas sp. HC1]|uniref:hypothetical protein n=1 Tax=Rhodopseudomonas infernalis TaxID=2897386 RepID=UPI001EE82D0B|nr:hypothetical protein [Rhodopseudomonas infernalis]MCG6203656.1 hypothetical protein [Rhodopseudomonas infernalis]
MRKPARTYPVTPDGRYFVVKGRLWRCADPSLSEANKAALVSSLMRARRAVKTAKDSGDQIAEATAHRAVDAAKRDLGERGPVWWTDGAPDYNRHLAKNTPYAKWYAALATTGGQ